MMKCLSISPSQSSAVVSILSAGTFFGAIGSSFFAEFLGRRWGLIASCCVFNLGVVFQTAADAIPMMLAGRFFAGTGVGLISAIGQYPALHRAPLLDLHRLCFRSTNTCPVPMYQSETAPSWIRGAVVGAYQWAITIGLLLSAVINNATHNRDDSGAYRIPIGIQFLWSLLLIAGMLILPETPRFLIKRGKSDEALRALSKLRGLPSDHAQLVQEHALIKAAHDEDTQYGEKGSYLGCFKGSMRKKMLIGMTIQALQQMSGEYNRLFRSAWGKSPSLFICDNRTNPSNRHQLHLLLWHAVLPQLGHFEPLRHHHGHLDGQRRVHYSRYPWCGSIWQTSSALLGRRRPGYQPACRCYPWYPVDYSRR